MSGRSKTCGILLCMAVLMAGCATRRPESAVIEQAGGIGLAQSVENQLGFYSDSYLLNYVDAIGRRLVSELDDAPAGMRFQIVDQAMPNVFSTSDGYIYLSRGLLALVGNEDELAAVLAHELAHVALRHRVHPLPAVQRPGGLQVSGKLVDTIVGKELAAIINAPVAQAGRVLPGAFTPEQEAEADVFGLRLAGEAGYEPAALATILRTLERTLAVLPDSGQDTGFFDRHPLTPRRIGRVERLGDTMRWRPAPHFAKDQAAFLKRLDGLYWGPGNPIQGLFQGQTFLQPDMRFVMTLPDGWRLANTPSFVGAFEPNRHAVLVFGGAGRLAPPQAYADEFAERVEKKLGIAPDESRSVELGNWPGWLLRYRDNSGVEPVSVYYLWIRSERTMFRVLAAGQDRYTETMKQSL
ncbi:MAG TPA: hypothetical protein ENK16_00820, partial [Chromatiales bacterium]|nr:hypothetical protein [Chromatiales bacterium]